MLLTTNGGFMMKTNKWLKRVPMVSLLAIVATILLLSILVSPMEAYAPSVRRFSGTNSSDCIIFGHILKVSGMSLIPQGVGVCVFDSPSCSSSDIHRVIADDSTSHTTYLVKGRGGDDIIRYAGHAGGHSDFCGTFDGDDYWVDANIPAAYSGKIFVIDGGLGADNLYCGCNPGSSYYWTGMDYCEVGGAPGDDKIWGSPLDDFLFGGTGGDEIFGGLGDDLIFGGDGDDTLIGHDGNDCIYGEDGNDDLYGEEDDYNNGGTCNFLHGGDDTAGDYCECACYGPPIGCTASMGKAIDCESSKRCVNNNCSCSETPP
jgi:hypothetical protein